MASLSFAVGIIGNILSIMVFASPIKTFVRVVKKKSTGDFKGAPYITTFLCTGLWAIYGLLKPGGFLIATVNGAGVLSQGIYILIFLLYSPPNKKMKMAMLVVAMDVCFLGIVVLITVFALHGPIQLAFLGMLCTALTVVMYASPLLALRMVIRTKSVEYMPFLLSFLLFINAGVWATYAFLVNDLYMIIPNMIGVFLGSGQLVVYVLYRKAGKVQSVVVVVEDTKLEDAITNLNLKDAEIVIIADDVVTTKTIKRMLSLPKPKIVPQPQKVVKTILKTLSFSSYTWTNPEPPRHHEEVAVKKVLKTTLSFGGYAWNNPHHSLPDVDFKNKPAPTPI